MQGQEVFERARLSRDARFDGQFYVGVRTTGIYCRPICPANPPRRENIRFYPTAAAASEAGYRPCLRCRPECAPGTPAWHGTSTTVRRGLRLIANGALDDGNVEQLAERLGVTSRHLRRLFTKHIGASPLAVAHTQRLHFAKSLIDETGLPLKDIAIAAGYGSVRRFNDTFRKTYGRAPRELRAKHATKTVNVKALSVRLGYRKPFDWKGMLGFWAGRTIPGVESVVDGHYRRSVVVDGNAGVIDVAKDSRADELILTVHGIRTSELLTVVQRVREMFDLDAPVTDIQKALSRDPILKPLVRASRGQRVPGTWDGFELAVRAVLGQQVSVKAATTLSGRVAGRYGEPIDARRFGEFAAFGITHVFPQPERLMRAQYKQLGLIGSRVDTIRAIARAVYRGELAFEAMQDPVEFHGCMTAIKGIGDWTAEYVAMRALKNPDAFPASDLGLLRAMEALTGTGLKPRELAQIAEAWRPWRAYACLLLWNSLANSGG